MLDVRSLSKQFHQKTAVQDLSFEIREHEIVGLLGHNGSGKSTTMGMIAGFLPPSSGEITLDGLHYASDPLEYKRRLGFLPEIPPIYPDMTVMEQMTFAANLRGLYAKAAKMQIQQALERVQLTDVRQRLVGNLSKGYRQRVGIAQALLGDPKLLIFDEPTVGLDPRQILEIRRLLLDLKNTHTIIMSSHILSEITAICSRLLILNHGRLVADDTPGRLIRRFSDTRGFQLCADADPEALLPLLRAQPFLQDVQLSAGEEGASVYTLHCQDQAEPHKAIFQLLCQHQYPIRYLIPLHSTLEDVFMKLTDENFREVCQ